MRTVILHYHLFKNAGTSVDHLLRLNFPNAWLTQEFPGRGGDNSGAVSDWIEASPNGIAFSSHTILGPIPKIDGVKIIPVVLLRDPVERILSAYNFERHQQANTKGAQLAKSRDLAGYIKARLAMPGDRQCRNFQTARLATMVSGHASELTRARTATQQLQQLGVLGLVSEFRSAMEQLSLHVSQNLPPLELPEVRANRASASRDPLPQKLLSLLVDNNGDDLALLDHVRDQLCAA